jgi:hypothetical protein
MSQPRRDDLIAQYSTQDVRHLIQVDIHLNASANDPRLQSDEDGDALTSSDTYGLRNFAGVRIEWPAGAGASTVIRALRKALHAIEGGRANYTRFTNEGERPEPSSLGDIPW